jgi:hypothetical protein
MIIKQGNLKFWPRVLFALTPICTGAMGVQKNIITNINWFWLSVIFSFIVYRIIDSSIEFHEEEIKLKGLMFSGTLRERPLGKIKSIDAVSSSGGGYFFHIKFDPSVVRSAFWRGTDNLLVLSPVFFTNTEDIIREIIKKKSDIKVETIVQELLDGKKKVPKHISELLFGGLSLTFIIGIILMLRGKI